MIGSSFASPSDSCCCSDSSVSRVPRLPSAFLLGLVLPQQRDLARLRRVRHHLERVSRLRESRQPEHLDGTGGSCLLDRLAAVVEQRPDPADVRADDEIVADVQGSVLHQYGGHRAAAAVDLRFQHRAARDPFGIGLVLAHFRDEEDHLEQRVEVLALLRGNRHHHGLAAPILGRQIPLGQLLLDAVRIRVRLVDLVDGDQDRDIGHARVVDRFLRLRHDAVVSRDDEHHDVRHARAARAHRGEGLVTGSVEEDDAALVDRDRIGADVLRDAACFPFGHARFTDGVEQRRLPVVHVPHHRHDRGARHEIVGIGYFRFEDDHLLLEAAHLDVGAELPRDHGRRLGVERRVDGQHHPFLDELLQDLLGLDLDLLGQVLDGHPLGQRDGPRNRRRRRRGPCHRLRARTPVGASPGRPWRSRRRPIADRRPRRERPGRRRAHRL